MARGFGSTLGAGTTDRIASTFAANTRGLSWYINAYRNGLGGSNFGRAWSQPGATTTDEVHLAVSSGTLMELTQGYDTTNQNWTFPLIATGAWRGILCAGDLTTASAYVWVDGVAQTLTRTGPAGSPIANGNPYSIGNRGDGLRVWDGMLADFAIWDVVLTQLEATMLAAGVSPALIRPDHLIEYIPMLRDNVSLRRLTPTITGTAVKPHPRIIMPKRHAIAFDFGTSVPNAAPNSSYQLQVVTNPSATPTALAASPNSAYHLQVAAAVLAAAIGTATPVAATHLQVASTVTAVPLAVATPAACTHLQVATSPTCTPVALAATPNAAYHLQVVTNPSAVPVAPATPASAYHLQVTTSVTAAMTGGVPNATPLDSYHVQAVTNPTATALGVAVLNSAYHLHVATSPTAIPTAPALASPTYHLHIAGSVAANASARPASAYHLQVVANPSIQPVGVAGPAATYHAQVASTPTAIPTGNATPAPSYHLQIVTAPAVLGFAFGNFQLPTLTFDLVLGALSIGAQYTVPWETNPYQPAIPESIQDIPSAGPELYAFMRAQTETLRDQHIKAQMGQTTLPYTELYENLDSDIHTLGSEGRFVHPDHGLITAVFVRFGAMNTAHTTGGPAGYLNGASLVDWVVTNDFTASSPMAALGFIAARKLPVAGQYGWLINSGTNLQPLTIRAGETVTQGLELTWSGVNEVSSITGGISLGRQYIGAARTHATGFEPGELVIDISSSLGRELFADANSRIQTLTTRTDAAEAAIVSLEGVQATVAGALSSTTTTIQANLAATTALVADESTSRVSGDEALAHRIVSVQASIGTAITGAVQSEATARAANDGVLLTMLDSVKASFTSQGTTLQRSIATLQNSVAVLTAESQASATQSSRLFASLESAIDENLYDYRTVGSTASGSTTIDYGGSYADVNLVAAGLVVGDYISASATLGGNLPYLHIDFYNVTNTLVWTVAGDSTVSASYPLTYQTISGVPIPATATYMRLRGTREAVSGTVSVTQGMLSRGKIARSYVEPTRGGSAAIVASASAITTLQASVTTLNGEYTTQAGQITTLQTNYTTLNGTVSSQGSAISSLTSSVSTLSGTLTTTSASVVNLQNNISGISAQMLPNWNFKVADSYGKPAGIWPCEGIADNSQVQLGGVGIQILNSPDITVGYGFPVIPIDSAQKYRVTFRHKSSIASAAGHYICMFESNTAMVTGKSHLGNFSDSITQIYTSSQFLVNNAAMPGTTLLEQSYTYTPTAGVKYLGIGMYNYNATAGCIYEVESVQIDVIPKTADDIAETAGRKWAAVSGADVTASASAFTTLSATVSTQGGQISTNASNISTLSTTVGGHTTSIATNTSSINGIWGKYAVTIDANGTVAGFQLTNGTGVVSEFRVQAANFVVYNGATAGDAPFQVVGGVTMIKTAAIQDATITNAKITNLTLDTGKIANNAVSNAWAYYSATAVYMAASSAYTLVATLTVTVTGGRVYISYSGVAATPATNDYVGLYLFRGNSSTGTLLYAASGLALAYFGSASAFNFSEVPAAGTYTYNVYGIGATTTYIGANSLYVQELKK